VPSGCRTGVGRPHVADASGVTANIISYIFNDDVALNVSPAAINSFLLVFMLPLIVGSALHHFMRANTDIALEFSKVLRVFMIVLGRVAAILEKPPKILAGVFFIGGGGAGAMG
jgi:hypothetical protein